MEAADDRVVVCGNVLGRAMYREECDCMVATIVGSIVRTSRCDEIYELGYLILARCLPPETSGLAIRSFISSRSSDRPYSPSIKSSGTIHSVYHVAAVERSFFLFVRGKTIAQTAMLPHRHQKSLHCIGDVMKMMLREQSCGGEVHVQAESGLGLL